MGFLSSVVMGSSAFILGMVFVCQVVDIPLLYKPVTNEALENAYTFYTIWFESPGAVKALFHVALALPLIGLLAKLHKWTESAMFFDGTGIALQVAIIIIYLTIHIQSLRTFLPEDTLIPTYSILPTPPPRTEPISEAERTESVRVLAAGNAIIGFLCLGIIGMQIGQEWASRQEDKEQRELDVRAKNVGVVGESKKDL